MHLTDAQRAVIAELIIEQLRTEHQENLQAGHDPEALRAEAARRITSIAEGTR